MGSSQGADAWCLGCEVHKPEDVTAESEGTQPASSRARSLLSEQVLPSQAPSYLYRSTSKHLLRVCQMQGLLPEIISPAHRLTASPSHDVCYSAKKK